jgi:N-dimethylarginine dimethylaminohydrolase
MAKEITPEGKISRWISGALAQVADPELIGMSRAVIGQMSDKRRMGEEETMAAMRDLLVAPIRDLGSADPQRDADAVFVCTVGTMRRYVNSTDQPGRKDINHLVGFCLRGLGVPEGER